MGSISLQKSYTQRTWTQLPLPANIVAHSAMSCVLLHIVQ